MRRYLGVGCFALQVFELLVASPRLALPVLCNIAVAVPFNLIVALAYAHTPSPATITTMGSASWTPVCALLGLALVALHLLDFVCSGLCASLIHDQVTGAIAEPGAALARVLRAGLDLVWLALIAAVADAPASYAQLRSDRVAVQLTRLLRAAWTPASCMLLPMLILDGPPLRQAVKRATGLMAPDPTGVGVGVVPVAGVGYAFSSVLYATVFGLFGLLHGPHPRTAVFVCLSLIHGYWSFSSYVRVSYHTCFYLWVKRCARDRSDNPLIAPAPLAVALVQSGYTLTSA